MLDYRYKTFLDLVTTKNYTRTAENLNMTQPTVSQHINYLQDHLDTDLVIYKNGKVNITDSGMHVYYLVKNIDNYIEKNFEIFIKNRVKTIKFGCTHTISETILAPTLSNFIKKNPEVTLNIFVENTENILRKMELGELECAFIEGEFDIGKFETIALKKEHLIGVCSIDSNFATGKFEIKDLINEPVYLREPGSGIAKAFIKEISHNGISLSSFSKKTIIGSTNLIRDIVKENLGISFLYESNVLEDINKNKLAKIDIPQFGLLENEFTCIYRSSNFSHIGPILNYFDLFKLNIDLNNLKTILK